MHRDNTYLIGNQFAKGAKPNKTAFRKGSVPWNKGIHRPTSEKSLRTCFKKGGVSPRTVPVGTVTIRVDKNGKQRRWIKTSEIKPRWTIYAQWLWIKHHGAIPLGLMVHHMDHDTLNDALSNYCLVTRSQHINHHRSELQAAKKK